MTEAQLEAFREIAAALAGPEAHDWEWIGEWESQRMFGITEERARRYARLHGGVARRMEPAMTDTEVKEWILERAARRAREELELAEGNFGEGRTS